MSRLTWTSAEDGILRAKYGEYGPKWTKISAFLPGRSANSVKNRMSILVRHNRRTSPSGAGRWGRGDREDDPVARFFADVKVDIFEDEISYIFSAF
jgi:hypothetical protein